MFFLVMHVKIMIPGVRNVEKLLCRMSFRFSAGISSGCTNFDITSYDSSM